MRRLLVAGSAALLVCSLMGPAAAGTFETAATLRPGHFSFGLQPALTLGSSRFTCDLEGAAGLTPGLDLTLRLGLWPDTALGARVKFGLVRDAGAVPGVSLLAGVHGPGPVGFDLGLLLSKRLHTFSLFTGLQVGIEPAPTAAAAYVPIGVAIPLNRACDFFLEGDINVTPTGLSALAGGLKVYL